MVIFVYHQRVNIESYSEIPVIKDFQKMAFQEWALFQSSRERYKRTNAKNFEVLIQVKTVKMIVDSSVQL